MVYHSCRPGQVWLDTEGKRIHAHGGSVIQADGVYYFYGENKEKTDGKNGIWHWGVRCYASTDLYNWEAPAHFIRHGKHYLITSGTTGYLPNPSEVAVGDSWHGPFQVLGDPHPGDASHTSFHSQISSVFQVPGKKDLYIACADRWLPGEMHRRYEDYARVYEIRYHPWKKADQKELEQNHSADIVANTSMADYVWLPLRFQEPDEEYPRGMVWIDWKDEWRIEDYE